MPETSMHVTSLCHASAEQPTLRTKHTKNPSPSMCRYTLIADLLDPKGVLGVVERRVQDHAAGNLFFD